MTTEEIKILIAETQERLELLKQVLTMEDEFAEVVDQIENRRGLHGMDRKTAMAIVRAVASETGVSPFAIMSRVRVGKLGTYRQIAMSLVRKRMDNTLEETGRFFRKDHGTILHAERTVQALSDTEPRFKALVQRIEARLDAEQTEPSTVRSAKV